MDNLSETIESANDLILSSTQIKRPPFFTQAPAQTEVGDGEKNFSWKMVSLFFLSLFTDRTAMEQIVDFNLGYIYLLYVLFEILLVWNIFQFYTSDHKWRYQSNCLQNERGNENLERNRSSRWRFQHSAVWLTIWILFQRGLPRWCRKVQVQGMESFLLKLDRFLTEHIDSK